MTSHMHKGGFSYPQPTPPPSPHSRGYATVCSNMNKAWLKIKRQASSEYTAKCSLDQLV